MTDKKAKEGSSGKEEEIYKEVQELQDRIRTLEDMIGRLMGPLSQMTEATGGYFKLMELYLRFGKISPDTIIPDLKDDISKEIVIVLFERNGQNISQITKAVKARRGTASRRIVRERLKDLEENGSLERRRKGKIDHYFISEHVVNKWSRVLGLDK